MSHGNPDEDIEQHESYHYCALHTGEDGCPQIRLLELKPGYRDDKIRCGLLPVPLGNSLQYETISYCWGDSTVRVPIECEGKRLDITRSLHSALLRFRDPDTPRILWADAICVNQNDTDERGSQVQIMRNIYKNCQRVLIWLGEEEASDSRWFSFIPQMLAVEQRVAEAAPFRSGFELTSADILRFGIPNEDHPAFASLQNVIQKPWFRRVWIVQELAVAPDAQICCGRHILSWEKFSQAIIFAFECGLLQKRGTKAFQSIMRLEKTRMAVVQNDEDRLLQICVQYRHFLATDPRDKIFALSGLSWDVNHLLKIVSDYHANVCTVYTQIAVATIRAYRNLDILSVPRISATNEHNLPTWIPDWSVSDSTATLLPRALTDDRFHFMGADGSSIPECPKFSEDMRFLIVEGHLVDQIAEVTAPWHGYTTAVDFSWRGTAARLCADYDTFNNWELVCQVKSANSYITGENRLDAYWLAISASFTPDGTDALETASRHFYEWRHDTRFLRFLASKRLLHLGWLSEILVLLYLLLRAPLHLMLYWRALGRQPVSKFRQCLVPALHRRVIRTRGGYIGLGPQLAEVGDHISIFKGGHMPFVIRKDGYMWEFIGDCYLHGMMHGERFDASKCKSMTLR